MKEYREMRTKLNNQENAEKTYNIGLLNVCNINYALPLVTAFCKENKDIQVSIQELEWQALQAKMIAGQLDVVISWDETMPDNLYQYPLMEDEVVMIVAEDHPLAVLGNGTPVSLAGVCDETFILANPNPPMKINNRAVPKSRFPAPLGTYNRPPVQHAAYGAGRDGGRADCKLHL